MFGFRKSLKKNLVQCDMCKSYTSSPFRCACETCTKRVCDKCFITMKCARCGRYIIKKCESCWLDTDLSSVITACRRCGDLVCFKCLSEYYEICERCL